MELLAAVLPSAPDEVLPHGTGEGSPGARGSGDSPSDPLGGRDGMHFLQKLSDAPLTDTTLSFVVELGRGLREVPAPMLRKLRRCVTLDVKFSPIAN